MRTLLTGPGATARAIRRHGRCFVRHHAGHSLTPPGKRYSHSRHAADATVLILSKRYLLALTISGQPDAEIYTCGDFPEFPCIGVCYSLLVPEMADLIPCSNHRN
jgi:hypothetical protein